MALPPFGVVGWAHPLTAAGVLFPGLGWVGLGLTVAVVLLLASWRPVPASVAVALLGVPMAMATAPAVPDASWQGLTTHFRFDSGTRDYLEDYRRQLALHRLIRTTTAPVVVLPETAGGRWGAATRALWLPLAGELGDRSVLLGAELPAGPGYDNVLIALDATGDRVVYRQRMPVPVSMWKPWVSDGAAAHWFATPVFELRQQRVAAFICYEQLLVWPVLHSLAYRPDVLVAIGNSWWAAGTSIPSIQTDTMEAWARLFDVPLVAAFNS
jgi:apolipoprotein N-acyltransferase